MEGFYKACEDYEQEHGSLDPVFQVIAAWMKHPLFVHAWAQVAPGPAATAAEMVTALHEALQDAAQEELEPEMNTCLRQGRGTGVSACILHLRVARPVASGRALLQADSPGGTTLSQDSLPPTTLNAVAEGPTVLLGKQSKPWVLLQVLCEFVEIIISVVAAVC